MTDSEEQKAFEDWYVATFRDDAGLKREWVLNRNDQSPNYYHSSTQRIWLAWKARAALTSTPEQT